MVSIFNFFDPGVYSLPKSARQINQEQEERNNHRISSIEQMSNAIDRIQLNQPAPESSSSRNSRRQQRRNPQSSQNQSQNREQNHRSHTTQFSIIPPQAQYSHYTHSHVEEISAITAANRRQKNEVNRPRNHAKNRRNNRKNRENTDQSKGDHQDVSKQLCEESIKNMKDKLVEINHISPENLTQMDRLIQNLSKQNYSAFIYNSYIFSYIT